MADNYLQFSTSIDELSVEQHTWLLRKFAEAEAALAAEDQSPWDVDTQRFVAIVVDAGCVEIKYKFESGENDKSLWLYADEHGNVDQAASLLAEFSSAFPEHEPLYFSWAETCSKPRIDEFGGGAFVTWRGHSRWMHTTTAIEQMEMDLINAVEPIQGVDDAR